MIFLQLTPLSKPVAIFEILILLAVAAFLGWLLARLIMQRRLKNLREQIEERRMQLAECRSFIPENKPEPQLRPLVGNASKTVYPVREPAPSRPDDLKVIEGIGTKIQELLNEEGIYTYEKLAETSPIRLSNILKNAGARFQIHDPTSWPQQAELAKYGKWDELQVLKDKLIGGRAV